MTDLQRRLFAAFESEYRSILESIRTILAAAESAGALTTTQVTDAFRLAHTLKGSAHVVGFPAVVTLAHRTESLFSRVREGKLTLGPDHIKTIYAVLGGVEDIVAALNASAQPDVSDLIARLDAALAAPATTAPPDATAPPAVAPPPPAAAVVTASVVATPPPPSAPALTVVPAPAASTPVAAGAPKDSEMVRLNAGHLDQLLGTAGALLTVIRGARHVDTKTQDVSRRIDVLAREWDLLRRSSVGVLQKMSQSPEFARVSQFLDLIAEDLRPLSKTLRGARDEAKQNDWELKRLGEQLEDDAARARIVPAETVLGGFTKMVRDLGTELNVGVDFRFIGLDVEADRIVLQGLKDPLMHILRNSLGHGLEPRATRVAAGKDPVGRLRVDLSTGAGRLLIKIEDDGRGLDEAKIREQAVEQGLVDAAGAARLTGEALYEMIFKPGFSTAPEVSNVSGRGMGMSIVAEAIERLRGTLTLNSTAGRGLILKISVPIALANHRLIMARVGDHTFAIPSAAVESLRRLRKVDVRTVNGAPSFTLNNQATPIASLAKALGLRGRDAALDGDFLPTVVIESEGRHLALTVDSIADECEAIIKNLGPAFFGQPVYTGAVLEGEGRVALVLNPAVLVERARTGGAFGRAADAGAAPTSPGRVAKVRLNILVVDDSITTRTLEKGILESNGHQVTLAVDGLDALSKLQTDVFDLVISDVEMPRLDGFGLVGAIRAQAKYARLPIIMVTSRDHPEDQARGLNAGANAYCFKQKFDQGDLIDTIRRVL